MTLKEKIVQIPFSNIGVSMVTIKEDYIKWYAPSIDYPCLLSTYYLYLPFQIVTSPLPLLKVGQEIGERDDLLCTVKNMILDIILKSKDIYKSDIVGF